MLKNIELFNKRAWLSPPNWPCPRCGSGILKNDKGKQGDFEHGWSKDAHGHEAWDPDWVSGSFVWILSCAKETCRHVVVVTGASELDWDVEDLGDGPEQVYQTYFLPKAFSDAPPLFQVSKKVPKEITAHVQTAFALFWLDHASCLNKIRLCIEELLTHEKVPRFRVNAGKRSPLSLHSRIEKFRAKNNELADLLMALKWLGNEGSHTGSKQKTIERAHVLEAFEILEFALSAIFEDKSKALARAAKKINKKKGL